MKNRKAHILRSALTLLLCISMFVGSTFAWFTDSVTTKGNIIQSGTLNLEMYWTDDLDSEWHNVETSEHKTIFDYEKWEPGYTSVRYIKLKNTGNLALNYKLAITPEGTIGKLAEVIQVYCAKNDQEIESLDDLENMGSIGLLDTVLNGGATVDGTLLPATQVGAFNPSGEVIITLAMSMLTTAGNEYQDEDAGKFSITAIATQASQESDSFGADYDTRAEYPVILRPNFASTTVNNVNDKVADEVTMTGEQVSAIVPAGVALESGVQSLSLQVTPLEKTTTDITVVDDEILIPIDVHVEGVAEDNTVPIIVELGEVLPKYLNMGNYVLYHVEDGANVAMTLIDDAAAFTAHNQYKYDPYTGEVTVAMATFSEVALVANMENAWSGNYENADTSWYTDSSNARATTDVYEICNADELAGFAQIVGGMAEGIGQDTFSGKTVKLISDINLGYGENSAIFTPIGYYYDGKISGVSFFEGTFDGNGHKIFDFYQNTWSITGDYDGTYYNDAMGLFGYVLNGKVANLTVDSFESDGEFTPTGVIAAYAVNSTFENIAITNCNPRVYNTGNGGIVGIGGNSDDPDNYKLTFNNITIDNTNTVTALWGSWDVACGGLVGMFRGAGHVYMTNCHVAAQMDVFNDVCGNYQYYWYRYSGMMVGTNKNMTTDKDGYTVPETSKFHAENCTVHFGEWNDYYYCELVANSLASYTHDHQFSRLEEIESLDEIKTGDAWTKAGNYLLISGDTKTCYHIVNKDGALVQHLHTDAGEETVNGEAVLKENNQIVYLPFNQLFTGYGWGVKHIPVYNGEDYAFKGITILDREVADSTEKFDKKFTGNFLYRVGNGNDVSVGTLFEKKDDVKVNDSGVWVTIEKTDENSNVSGTFTANTTDWTKGTIKFSGTGVVKVTIQDYDFCTPTVLYVEVVDAANITTATSATKNNVVLLNDCGFSSLEVSGGYTLYGNGFTMTCSSDSAALDLGYSFVTLNNGTLDNVQIVCPNYDYAALYKSNLTSGDNRSETTDKIRYYNAKSGVMASGNSQILNSRISGGRASLNVSGGNVVVDNSRIELGAVASILVGSANSLTLRDVTLIQRPTSSTQDSNKKLMGFSVLYMCDSEGKATPTTLEGSFVQQAWVNADDKQYVPSAGQDIVDAVMKETAFIHDINGKDSLNLGFAYMPEDPQKTVAAPDNITDNRTDKATIPYEIKDVKIQIAILSTTVYVYSYKNTNGTAGSFKTESDYVANKYNDIITVSYADTADGLTTGKSYGTNGWVYELNVDLDKLPGYALDFSKMSMSVNGVTVTDFKVDGSPKPTSPSAVTAGGTTYILTATVNGKEHTAHYKVTGTETSKESPSLVGTPSYGAGFGVANKYGGDWSAAAPVLDGITIKYWSVAASEYKEFALSSINFANTGKQNGTNNYWEYTHAQNDFTLKLTNTAVMHSNSGTYGMPVAGKDGKLYFTIASSGGFVSTGTTSRSITIAYEFTDNNGGDTLKFSHTWSIPYSKDEQYNYSSFISDGTLTKLEAGSSGCVTPDTLITLADGTQKRVDSLTGDEQLLVWNLKTGKYDTAPIVFVDSEAEAEYEIIHLYFSDGSDVKVISEHGFFDVNLGKYVYIDANNYADYIGHKFVKEGKIARNTWKTAKLEKVVLEKEVTTAWSPVTFEHLCYYTNGMLSMPGGIDGLFNIFEVNTRTMRYDAKQMEADIETYGLFTFEDFEGLIPEEAFVAFNGQYLKVAVGKGLLTWEDIYRLAEHYVPLMK